MNRVYDVLFLCTHNSARSLFAECLLVRWGGDRFRAHSAGSHPRGEPHPLAIRVLNQFNHPIEGLRSKSWDEFAAPGTPPLDFVFTVCDQVAGEACPSWPGQPMTAHWGIHDPSAFVGPEEKALARFKRAYLELDSRIRIFASLRTEGLDRLTLKRRLDAIGTGTMDGNERT